jgi:hypothetical protein
MGTLGAVQRMEIETQVRMLVADRLGVELTVPSGASDETVAWLQERFAPLRRRGGELDVRHEPPVGRRARETEGLRSVCA